MLFRSRGQRLLALLLNSRSSQRRLLAPLLLLVLLSRQHALPALVLENCPALGVLKGTPGMLQAQALGFGLLALALLVIGQPSSITTATVPIRSRRLTLADEASPVRGAEDRVERGGCCISG